MQLVVTPVVILKHGWLTEDAYTVPDDDFHYSLVEEYIYRLLFDDTKENRKRAEGFSENKKAPIFKRICLP